MRVPDQLAREEHDVRLPVLEDALGLLGLGDLTDRTNGQVREGFLQLVREWYLSWRSIRILDRGKNIT